MNVVKQCVSIITSYAKKFASINKTWNYKLKGYKMLS